MPTFIETHTGKSFFSRAPRIEDIDIRDIAHALSHQCRFSGHTRVHYSVAEHCVRVAELIEAWGGSVADQLWGLLHDAPEAYLVDLPAPLKCDPAYSIYSTDEKHLMAAVCERFGLLPDEPWVVKQADGVLLATEARDLMPFRPEHWAKLQFEPLPEPIEPWGSDVAKLRFTLKYHALTAAKEAPTTPAPTAVRLPVVATYKVGDRVEVVSAPAWWSADRVGLVGTIMNVTSDNGSVAVSFGGGLCAAMPANCIAPVMVEPPEPPTQAFVQSWEAARPVYSGSLVTTGEVRVVDPKTGALKGMKPERYDLLPWDAMDEVARVYGFGATKYADDNWLKGYAWRLSLGACARHLSKILQGEDRDAESGLLHAAHIAWHALTICTFMMRNLGTDDRRGPALDEPVPYRLQDDRVLP